MDVASFKWDEFPNVVYLSELWYVHWKVNGSHDNVTTIWFYFSFANREKRIYRVSDIILLHKN